MILVGHSMAGAVISQVAENMPNKIDKLVYVSAYLPKNGESLQTINTGFYGNKPIEIFEFNKDYSLISVKKDAIPAVVCADCDDYMKDILKKYHRAEPVKGFNDVVKLGSNFSKVSKYYISTKNDNAVPYALQQKMIKANGSIKKVYEIETSHLPFVVKPQEFLTILNSIKQ